VRRYQFDYGQCPERSGRYPLCYAFELGRIDSSHFGSGDWTIPRLVRNSWYLGHVHHLGVSAGVDSLGPLLGWILEDDAGNRSRLKWPTNRSIVMSARQERVRSNSPSFAFGFPRLAGNQGSICGLLGVELNTLPVKGARVAL